MILDVASVIIHRLKANEGYQDMVNGSLALIWPHSKAGCYRNFDWYVINLSSPVIAIRLYIFTP
jgi:hypothetical protein